MRASRLLIDAGSLHSSAAHVGMFVVRAFAGAALALAHGINKLPPSEGLVGWIGQMGFPAPHLFAWLSGVAEFGGGLLLAIGLFTRPAALLVLGNMTVVVLVAHAGDPFADRELPLLFWVIALQFLLAGPGKYSVDALLRRRMGNVDE
jgi:putative oxidoreductase